MGGGIEAAQAGGRGHHLVRRDALFDPVDQLRLHVELVGGRPAAAVAHAGHHVGAGIVLRVATHFPVHRFAPTQRVEHRHRRVGHAVVDHELAAARLEGAEVGGVGEGQGGGRRRPVSIKFFRVVFTVST